MNKIFLFFALTATLRVTAQEKFIFDTSKVDAGTYLIGRYPQHDKEKTYKKLNFIIGDPGEIKRIIPTLSLGDDLGENIFEDPGFRISIIQNKEEIKTWLVNPFFNSILYNGHTYAFDIKKVKTIAKNHPFDYRFDNIAFKSKIEFDTFKEKQQRDTTFLFAYMPEFKYEGSFEIQFPRNDQFSSPKVIYEYLTPLIEKLVLFNEYGLSYILNDKNRDDKTQFTITIRGSKKIYDELQLANLKKENWKETVEIGWFFYRTR